MHSRLKFAIAALFSATLGMSAATASAANGLCVRLIIGGDATLYQDYNIATQKLTTQTYEGDAGSRLWVDSSQRSGSAAIVITAVDENGIEASSLRLIEGSSGAIHDVAVEGVLRDEPGFGRSTTGWSYDGQYYAVSVTSPTSIDPIFMIFDKVGAAVATTPYEALLGPAIWSWSPQSDRILIVHGDPVKRDSTMYIGASILTIDGDLISVDLPQSLYMGDMETTLVDWSPDGDFIVLADHDWLQLVNANTGEVLPLSTNHYFDVGDGSEFMWTADSQYFLYLSKSHYDEDATLVLLRYNASTGKTTELLDFVVPTYRFSPDTAGENQRYMAGKIQGDSSKSVVVDGITGEIHTLGQGQDYYEWSPTGDTLLTQGAAGGFIVPLETEDAFQLPGTRFANTLMWSPNGEWMAFTLLDDSGATTPWIMNVKTGDLKELGASLDYVDIGPGDQGTAFLREGTRLSIVAPDSTEYVLLTETASDVYDFDAPQGLYWSPDGQMAAYTGLVTSENSLPLHIIGSDGTALADIDVPLGEGYEVGLKWVDCGS